MPLIEYRRYNYPSETSKKVKNGETHFYKNSSTKLYKLKLHHPNDEEIEEIKSEIATGETKTATALKHNISLYRLNKLIK